MRKKHLAIILAVVVIAAGVYATHGMWGGKKVAEPPALEKPPSATPLTKPVVAEVFENSGFDIAYEPKQFKASVAPYSVQADLSNVANPKAFGKFTAEQKALLAKNAFFARPTNQQQLFFIYEQNDYKNVPSFITTDSVLQVYHIFYDFTLRNMESGKLYDILGTLADSMIAESKTVGGKLTDPKWKKAAQMNEVYFAVPASVMGRKVTLSTSEQKKILSKELDLVNRAPGRVMSALFPWKPDYSQFKPRGHYTRSDKLKRFFRAMMWYGYMPFPADAPDVIDPPIKGGPAWPQIRQAVLWTKMLFDTKISGRPAIESWERIYQPTVFYVGVSDDLTPYQYKAIMDRIYGKNASYADLQDESKLKKVYAALIKLPRPRIDVALEEMPGGAALKFMGQRYIPDSEIMQRLVIPMERTMPKGLDVMAVLGSERAADIMDNVYGERMDWYLAERSKLRKEFNAVPDKTWRSNLYWGWMWGLDSLIDTFGEGYPSFMRNQAWDDKGLNTSLASWAELRHDTILYAKQSGAECGGDGDIPPPPAKGYVEPNVEFYERLLWLTKASRAGLKSRGLINDEMADKFGQFEDLLTFLRDISIKELTNKKLTEEEYWRIKTYGGQMELLTLSVIQEGATDWFSITSESDRDMAQVADVHTSGANCLEEGVGHANEVFVVVPIDGKLYLTRGAIFSYYEFGQPLSNRLTDEAWQKMLKTGNAPPVPVWTKSFLNGVKNVEDTPREVPQTGC